MATNKERIISHNTRLQNISTELDTLPTYENLDAEITEQTSTIADITEALVGKAAGTKSGMYVWKKMTTQGGDFVNFVVSDSETAYPDGGLQDGYWYEKFNEKK